MSLCCIKEWLYLMYPLLIGLVTLLCVVAVYFYLFPLQLFYFLSSLGTRSLGFTRRYTKLSGERVCSYAEKRNAGARDTLFLLHGFCASSFSMLPLGRCFQNYRVISMDWLNHGYSSSKNDLQIEDILQFIDEFIDTFDGSLGKVHLVGHSTGGYIAPLYAITYPNKISSVSLLSPLGVEFVLHDKPEIVRDMIYPASNEFLMNFKNEMLSNGKEISFPDVLVTCFRTWLLKKADKHYQARKILDAKFTHDDMVKLSKIPSLLIWAGDDRTLPIKPGVEFFKENSPTTKVEILEGASHMFTEIQPTSIHKIMSSFYDQLK